MRIKNLWAIEPHAFQALMAQWRGLSGLRITAEMLDKAAAVQAAMSAAVTIDDAARVGYPVTRRGDTAIIGINGPLMKKPNWILRMFYGVGSTADVTAAVKIAATDDSVRNLLLRVDSPGGEVDGIAELQDALTATKAQKPVVAFADGTAASLAYWAASQGNKLYLDRLSEVGSIGVFMALYDFSSMYEAAGIKTHLITTGDFKGAGVDGAPVTEEQLAEFQRMVDVYFGAFTDAVEEGRGLSASAVKQVADGRMFIGAEAVKVGLADKVQSLDETLANIDQGRGLRKRVTQANATMGLKLRELPEP